MTACTAATAIAIAHRFVGAWNARDVPAAVALWAAEPAFQWLSGPGRTGSRAYRRATLAPYLRSRRERLRIVTMHAGYDPARDLVNFSGTLSTGPFKGAITCSTSRPRLIVWSM